MPTESPFDESLAQRLPLPLAQLYRRAGNAKTARDRHDAAYYLWEAGLKLLGSVAVVTYAERQHDDPALTERLQSLARPSLGHWWEFVRRLVPIVAAGAPSFVPVCELLLGKPRDDLPRTTGLDASLGEALEGKATARSTVELAKLFDRLIQYRNREIGHGAVGQKPASHYQKLGSALLAGVPPLWGRLDVLAGHRLVYIAEVRRRGDGAWNVERHDLSREMGQRVESLNVPGSEADRLPHPERLYLEKPAGSEADDLARLVLLHPLVIYDADTNEVLFLNARRGKLKAEYLSYTTGRVLERADLAGEQRELLQRVLDIPAEQIDTAAWSALSAAEDPEASAEGEPPAEMAPRQIGEFELISKLGQGGMGIVYRARQPSLGRQVALKCLFRSGDPKAEARFAREIRSLGQVEHPSLVKVYSSGSEGDQWFYAMELIEGTTLAAVCDRLQSRGSSVRDLDLPTWQETVSTVCAEARQAEMPLTPPSSETGSSSTPSASTAHASHPSPLASRSYVRHVVELVRQVAEAAHALHEKGIIHRDIKPGNIMVGPDGTTAVLMDLGLAQVADEVEGRLTKTRQFVGTLRYASPEQVLAVGRLDRTSDVYSLGATLWELLTLRPMFGATDATPTPELMRRIQYEEAGRLRKQDPRIPRDLDAVVGKCLHKDPRRRYPAANALVVDLENLLEGKPVQARPVSGLERARRWARRRPALATLAMVSLLAAVTLLIGATWFTLKLNAKHQEAVLQQLEAEKQQGIAELKAKELEEALTKVKNAERRSNDDLEQLAVVTLQAADSSWEAGHVEQAREQLHLVPVALRNWEWRYLYRRFRGAYCTLYGHTAAVNSVEFSGDGRRIASCSSDRSIKLWDAGSGQEVFTLYGHNDSVSSLAFAPDGLRLASASADKTVKLWDTRNGKELVTLQGHSKPLRNLAFSPDGYRLAGAGDDRTIRLWDPFTGKEVLHWEGHADRVSSVAFSPDGRRLATASDDRTIRIWDRSSGRILLVLEGHSRSVSSVSFSPDGNRLASSSDDRTARLWDGRTGQHLRSFKGHTDRVRSAIFSPEGERLATCSDDNTLKVWDIGSGQVLRTFRGHVGRVGNLRYSPDGQRLASSSDDRTIKLWDARAGRYSLTLEGQSTRIVSIAIGANGRILASGNDDNSVRLWNATSGHELLSLRGHSGPVLSVAFCPTANYLASGSQDGTIRVWQLDNGRERLLLHGHTLGIGGLAYSPDGLTLASGSDDRTIRLWDARDGRELRTLRGHSERVNRVAFSPDGLRLVSGSDDKTIKVWDANSGQELLTCDGHTDGVSSLVFSPDGLRLASGSGDSAIKIWDARTGHGLTTLNAHTQPVLSVAFSPDGQRLASSSLDGTTRLWDPRTGRELLKLNHQAESCTCLTFSPDGLRLAICAADRGIEFLDGRDSRELTLKGHTTRIETVAFSPNGERLASGSYDGTVKVWNTRTEQELLSLTGHSKPIRTIAFSPGGEMLASGSDDNTVKVWDAGTGKELVTLRKHERGVSRLAFSPDGFQLVTASDDGAIKLWDPLWLNCLSLQGDDTGIQSLAFSADGNVIIAECSTGKVKAWDARIGTDFPAPPTTKLLTDRGSFSTLRGALALSENSQIRIVELAQSDEHDRGLRAAMSRFDGSWHTREAVRHEQLENWFAATFHRRQLANHTPDSVSARLRLVTAFARQGDSKSALAACDRLLQQNPTLAPAYFRRARLWGNLLQLESATNDQLAGLAWAAATPFGWPDLANDEAEIGEELARRGSWSEACHALTLAAICDQRQAAHRHRLAWAQLAADRREAYRDTCRMLYEGCRNRSIIEHQCSALASLNFGIGIGPAVLVGCVIPLIDVITEGTQSSWRKSLVYAAFLVPDRGFSADGLLRRVRVSLEVARRSGDDDRIWNSLEILGATLSRTDQVGENRDYLLAEAKDYLQEAIRRHGNGGTTWMKMFLALAYQRCGQSGKAQEWLDRAQLSKDARWEDRLIHDQLRKEVEEIRRKYMFGD